MPRHAFTGHKVGVIGTINRDTIHRSDGSTVESWGGILYNLKYLCASGAVEVSPAVNVGADSYRAIMRILMQLEGTDLSGVVRVPENNNHCFLHYADQSHKCEVLKGGVPPLTLRRIEPLLDRDLVLVNFISGPDVRLAALETFRQRYAGIIYMDIHSLTLGRRRIPGGYRRFMRRPRNWKRYAACADILQMNATEFELLSGWSFSADRAGRFYDRELSHLTCLAVTLGADGCLVTYRAGRTESRRLPAVRIGQVHDTTGCGDIFAAGFIVEYLRSGDPVSSARAGNRLAAARCRRRGEVF